MLIAFGILTTVLLWYFYYSLELVVNGAMGVNFLNVWGYVWEEIVWIKTGKHKKDRLYPGPIHFCLTHIVFPVFVFCLLMFIFG